MSLSRASSLPAWRGLVSLAVWGGLAGIAGGVVFALVWLLAAGPLVIQVLDSISLATTRIVNPVLGMVAHMVISGAFGVTYSVSVSNLFSARLRYRRAMALGLLYGILWWILGGLVLLPVLLGHAPQFAAAFTPPFLVDLAAHLVYGAVTALALVWLAHRGGAAKRGMLARAA